MNPTIHLTEQQFYDLLIASPNENSPELKHLRDHLLCCPECAAELASLRQPLGDFRSSVTAWACHHSANRSWAPASPISSFGTLSAWLLAAAALILLLALPFATHHESQTVANVNATHSDTRASAASTTIRDEALLEEVNQTVSSSIPTPMQPLADPTATDANRNYSNSRN